ncbi:MAG: aa3-type cytochrome c oxidase subunit IV [Rhodobacteraceae bacterium]|nr:aa3-type cytochrome c oxidase subunit IV [Paracoccaceae bacterium]MCY4197924.1 aa3-type cytochrome c oxidase subunit IV [Paracoccaceae bacterium]MCY4326117.1 aa3-type cytochrome c oxidase subunit IV [Paracoccaceae bacterium]
MSEHQHGSMDITQHERAFAGFLRISTRVTIVIIAALVFLAIFNS